MLVFSSKEPSDNGYVGPAGRCAARRMHRCDSWSQSLLQGEKGASANSGVRRCGEEVASETASTQFNVLDSITCPTMSAPMHFHAHLQTGSNKKRRRELNVCHVAIALLFVL